MKLGMSVILAFMTFSFCAWIGNWSENSELRDRLRQNEETISYLRAEHKLAITMANEALREREKIRDAFDAKSNEVEKILKDNHNFSGILLPDNLRLRLDGNNNQDSEISAADGIAE